MEYRRAGKIAIFLLFAVALALFFALGGLDYLDLDTIKANRDTLLAYTESHYATAALLAFLAYVVSAALSLPAGLVLSLTIGFLFGRWIGSLIIVAGATVGATFLFLAARYIFADAARRRMGTLGTRIVAGFDKDAFSYLLFLRLVPLFPFFLVNLAMAFTGIGLRTYFLATLIGMVPAVFVFANLGQTLGRIESTRQLLSLEIVGAFTLLGLLALLPVLLKRRKPALGSK
jgi:uncharacterized membrane protein YdjX (TVP38/TMEM64 family)